MNQIIRIGLAMGAIGATSMVAGCGGGSGPNDNLLTLRPGQTWVYNLAGNVTLPASQGGGTQALQAISNLTLQVANSTARDLNNDEVGILERKIDATLLDGRQVKGNFRLYFSQTNLGIFVHGFNDYVGTTVNAANDVFVPGTANPAFKFLYLPNPLADQARISYTNPLGINTTKDVSYDLTVGTPRQEVNVPAGRFFAKPISIVEDFNRPLALTTSGLVPFSVTNGAFDPGAGLISGVFKATLPDGTQFNGTIVLKSKSG